MVEMSGARICNENDVWTSVWHRWLAGKFEWVQPMLRKDAITQFDKEHFEQ